MKRVKTIDTLSLLGPEVNAEGLVSAKGLEKAYNDVLNR